jgi:Tfp pilus assembly protein PilX
MNSPASARRTNAQSGAALVVGLILLLAISLLAIANINSTSVDLIATNSEQFSARAFQSAETGIAKAMLNDTAFSTANKFSPAIDVAAGTGNDTYQYTVTRPLSEVNLPAPGNSETAFSAIYFRITATGHSEHAAVAQNVQELYEVVHAPNIVAYSVTACRGTTSLDGAISSC